MPEPARRIATAAPQRSIESMSADGARRLGKPRLCIVCLYGWPLLEPACGSAFGGSEVRIVSFARGLARRGNLDVSLVVWDHGQGARTMREGIEVFAWP